MCCVFAEYVRRRFTDICRRFHDKERKFSVFIVHSSSHASVRQAWPVDLTTATRGAAPTTSVYPGTPSGVNTRTGSSRALTCTVESTNSLLLTPPFLR